MGAGGRVEVVGHRGAAAHAPENTLAAFRRGIELGADWVECDCTLTRDGEVVVIHDDTLERTTDGRGPVGARTLAELRALDAGAWFDPSFRGERIPTLGEVLALARGRARVLVEVKPLGRQDALLLELLRRGAALPPGPGRRADLLERAEVAGSPEPALARAVVDVLRAHAAPGAAVLQSFSPLVCLAAGAADPALRVELLVWDDPDDPRVWPGYLRWAELLGVPGVNPALEDLTPERLAELRRGGRTVSVWTVNAAEDVRRLASWGVDRLISDRPDLCVAVLEAMGGPGPHTGSL